MDFEILHVILSVHKLQKHQVLENGLKTSSFKT